MVAYAKDNPKRLVAESREAQQLLKLPAQNRNS